MKTLHLKTILALMPVVLFGCAHQQQTADEPARLHAMPFNVVSTGDSSANTATAETFSWATGIAPVTGDPRMEDVPVKALLEEAITDTLQQKGYRFSDATGQGDLLVSYAVNLDDAAADRQLANRYGLQADLKYTSPDPDRFEKGTLVIDIIEQQSRLTAWRSSLQGFAYLQMNEAERRQRIHAMVQRMLAGLPARK